MAQDFGALAADCRASLARVRLPGLDPPRAMGVLVSGTDHCLAARSQPNACLAARLPPAELG